MKTIRIESYMLNGFNSHNAFFEEFFLESVKLRAGDQLGTTMLVPRAVLRQMCDVWRRVRPCYEMWSRGLRASREQEQGKALVTRDT